MTVEIEFSLMDATSAHIEPLLRRFEAETGIAVRVRLMRWDTAWTELVKVALYGDGPDLSEIGSTWLGDLAVMNALVPFAASDVAAFGGPTAFLPSAWAGTRLVGQTETWAIPWLTGARLVFYRRSLLRAAGIAEQTAFHTPERFETTLTRLHRHGVPVPWTIPTGLTHTTLLNAASWVWGAGGDFVTADGRNSQFTSPASLAGLRAYFALGRFLAPSVQSLNGLEPDRQFLNDPGTAVTLSGSWLFDQASPELRADLGAALPPGASFVGGSHLVIWKHSQHLEAARHLIRFLTRPDTEVIHSRQMGLMPATLDGLASAPYATDPLWQKAIEGLKTGRSFPVTRFWGLMEDRLSSAFAALWKDVLNQPDLDLEAALLRHLMPLAKRLDLVLGQS